ncbi:hypothetical protein INR49_019107 [Caranx melampygus]|nr:hypothetical protein INR49_019107 [Caranx melampygus]
MEKPSNTSVPIISALVPLALILIAITGFLVYKQSSVCQSNMEKLLMLLLFYHVSSAVEHSLRFDFMISSGHPNIPDYMVAADVDEVKMAYYDSSMKTLEPRQDWVIKFIEDDQEDWERHTGGAQNYEKLLRVRTAGFKQQSNQTEGLHIIQLMLGCKWDDDTQKVECFLKYGYNGDDFLSFDLQTLTWIAAKPQAETIKQQWDGDTARMSLLQKTPSSPVSCHATGFYPHRALVFWTKDGEELHEDVDQGEILPNHDGTFQMTVDLDVSSVKAEDWRRYDCVFQFSGVKDDIVTKLDKAQIRTNMEKPSNTSVLIIAALVPLALILITVTGFLVYKQTKDKHRPTVLYAGILRGVGIVLLLAACITGMILYTRKRNSVCQSNMEKLLMLLLFYHVSSAVEHSMRFHVMISSGHPNIPDYMAVVNIDGVHMAYYDSSMKTLEPRQDWVLNFIKDEQEDWERLTGYGINYEQQIRGETASFKQQSNQTEVSLLQKTPSSPVSCHATGFYPDRALVFWTKDGEELHEDVDQGEILPNHDGTFQVTVDLNVSSVKAEDWRRCDCVFQLSGVKDDIVTKLGKALIRTNMGKSDIMVVVDKFPETITCCLHKRATNTIQQSSDDETSRVVRRRKKSSSVCQSNMEKLLMLLLFCHVSSAVEHSMRFDMMISSGHPNIPDYMTAADIDEVKTGYYDSSMETLEPRQDWVLNFIEDDPDNWERFSRECINYEQVLRVDTAGFKQQSNQTEGLHIIQQVLGCKWDNETQNVDCFLKYGYNGDDFISLDLHTLTWIAANPQAETIKQQWDEDTAEIRPSVSLLQKTPSSPVSCHATGFYPDRALVFWTKDGEELHEDRCPGTGS